MAVPKKKKSNSWKKYYKNIKKLQLKNFFFKNILIHNYKKNKVTNHSFYLFL